VRLLHPTEHELMTVTRENPFTRGGKSKLEREFDRFHAENPQVYEELVWLARKGKEAGADEARNRAAL